MWDVPAVDPGIEMVVASHGMSKGVSQTDGPQLIARSYLQIGDLQLSGQWKNVNSNSASGEVATSLNLTRKFGDLQLSTGITFKALMDTPSGIDSDCVEITAGASRKLGHTALRLNAIYSPDDLGSTKRSLYLEAGPTFDATKAIRFSANLGHRWRENGVDYTSVNAGAAYTVSKRLALDLRYYRTNRAELGDVYRQRFVLAGKLTF